MRIESSGLLVAALAAAALAPASRAAEPQPGERGIDGVEPISGVVGAGAEWELIWADFDTADGIVGTPDGGLMFAQEQTDTIRKLDADGGDERVVLENMNGAGAVSMDSEGRVFTVQRTCTEPLNAEKPGCSELTKVAQVYPRQRILASSFADGEPLGRLNDLVTDGRGGAYFTVGGLYHASRVGEITTVAEDDIHTNGVMRSPDGRRLYVTNENEVLAFDVPPDGAPRNRRVFGSLDGDSGGDGMAVDAQGRLYVTASEGVHVLASDGAHLGVIRTPRYPITTAFSGPDKGTLYVATMGAVGPDGTPWETPDGVRNTAMTVYRLPMLAQGYAGRPK